MGKKIGQPFVAITDGDMAVLRRLGRNAPRAIWLLTILRRQAGAKKLVEISDSQLARAGKVSTSTVYYGIADLIELNFIRKASGDRVGRRKIANAYQILPSPIVRDEPNGSSEIEERFLEIEDQALGSRGTNGQKPRNKRPKIEEPLIDNRDIDILDDEKKEDSCLQKVKLLLGGMGIANAMDRNSYALEIIGAGLTDEDVRNAMKIAVYEVGMARTRGGKELGGIAGQRGWNGWLKREALKYGRGIINNHIETGEPIELPVEVRSVGC